MSIPPLSNKKLNTFYTFKFLILNHISNFCSIIKSDVVIYLISPEIINLWLYIYLIRLFLEGVNFMEVHSKRRALALKRRFYWRLFALVVLLMLITIFVFIRCSSDHIFTICIDPGHGEYDPGAINQSIKVNEKDLVLDVSLKLGEILEEQDVKVIYTRKKDKIPWKNQKESLAGRSKISNKSKADIFISIHANNFPKSSDVKGTEIWCRFKDTEDEILAQEVSNRLARIGYTKDRGLRYEADGELYVLRNTEAISVLVELGYLSNSEDTQFLISEEGKNQCAEAIAEAIMNYYSHYIAPSS